MPLVVERDAVLELYREAGARGWVIPAFCSENQTTTEAVLAATLAHAERIGCPDLPITLAITNNYAHRSQTAQYTHTRNWEIGLKLFMGDLAVLTAPPSPYAGLRVMVHLDHIQPDADRELLAWDLSGFSSIMFDASGLPFEQNIALTRRFMKERGREIVVEGACDEIIDAGGQEVNRLTTPERAETYTRETGVDLIVANLGTEHRASAAELVYRGDLARQIKACVGPRLVLHGCSSVPPDQVRALYHDGVCKVNLWTALERDSSPALLAEMVKHAARVAGPHQARALQEAGLLGSTAEVDRRADLGYFTTSYRQAIIHAEMQRITSSYLDLWYTLEEARA